MMYMLSIKIRILLGFAHMERKRMRKYRVFAVTSLSNAALTTATFAFVYALCEQVLKIHSLFAHMLSRIEEDEL